MLLAFHSLAMILKGPQSYRNVSTSNPDPSPEHGPANDDARLCSGVFRIKAAFQEVMEAVAAAECPPGKGRAPKSPSSSRRRAARMPEAAPVERRKWEIDAALDFAFSGLDERVPKATPEEIAASLDEALPEDAVPRFRQAVSLPEAEVFIIPYDFELRCLLNLGQGPAGARWVPASILPSSRDQGQKI